MTVKWMLYFCLFFSICVSYNIALDADNLVFIIINQENKYHLKLAEETRYVIEQEALTLGREPPVIHLSHVDFSLIGDWTILPLIPKLQLLHGRNSSWFIFVEDRTEVKLEKLVRTLSKYNKTQDIWLGYALRDKEATIIHHFAFYQDPEAFKYPHFASGFAITSPLLQKLADRLDKHSSHSDFSIDSSHELATFIWDEGRGVALTHEPSFCITEKDYCSTIAKPFKACDNPIPIDSLYFVVKTCSKFHHDRIPVVKKTWAIHTSKINFFSDLRDDDIPTEDLGIPNTETGHCGKTMAILKYAARKIERDNDIKWVILADDDTLFSVPRLQRLLTCYDSTSLMVVGERYGYNVYTNEGYNYITGGGGIVFSRKLIKYLSKTSICECPTISTPDDMYLGICVSAIGGKLIHSSFFHQARPMDYAEDYLKTQMLVSFHKHWMIDPLSVYKKWLLINDDIFNNVTHTEL